MRLYLKLGILVYCLILPIGYGVSQLYAKGALHGDYVMAIRNPEKMLRRGFYRMDVQPSEFFTLRPSARASQGFHHGLLLQSGKLVIFKECPIDLEQDPVENSCKAVYAYI